jgi:5-dehydro-4-deoxyglucarate dehydratase
VMKAMMQIQGRAAGPVRPPLANLNAGELDELRAMMDTWTDYL